MGVIRNPLVLIRADICIFEAIMDWQMLDLSFHEYMKENWSGKQDCFEGWRGSLFSHFSEGQGKDCPISHQIEETIRCSFYKWTPEM